MPTGAVMLIRLASEPVWGDPNRWRRDILTEFDPEIFRYRGPLEVVEPADYWGPMSADGSTWIDVGVTEAYYGKGYERGDLPLLVRIAEWLERRIPGAEVWYGHDAADEAQPFGPPERDALMAYFNQVGHEPYDSRARQRRFRIAQNKKPPE